MTIQVQDKTIGLKFNNYAIEQLTTVKNRDKGYYAFVTTLVWCAYLGWCFAKQNDPELEFEAINDWVDSSVNNPEVAETIGKIYEEYQKCEAYKKLQKKSELNGQLEPEPAEEK